MHGLEPLSDLILICFILALPATLLPCGWIMNSREGKVGARTDRGVLLGPTAGHAGQTNKRHLSPQKKDKIKINYWSPIYNVSVFPDCLVLLRCISAWFSSSISSLGGLPRWLRGKKIHLPNGRWGFNSCTGNILGEGNGNPLQYSCLGNPLDREPGGLQSMRLQRVRHNLASKQQQTTYHAWGSLSFLNL